MQKDVDGRMTFNALMWRNLRLRRPLEIIKYWPSAGLFTIFFILSLTSACTSNRTLCTLQLQVHTLLCTHIHLSWQLNYLVLSCLAYCLTQGVGVSHMYVCLACFVSSCLNRSHCQSAVRTNTSLAVETAHNQQYYVSNITYVKMR